MPPFSGDARSSRILRAPRRTRASDPSTPYSVSRSIDQCGPVYFGAYTPPPFQLPIAFWRWRIVEIGGEDIARPSASRRGRRGRASRGARGADRPAAARATSSLRRAAEAQRQDVAARRDGGRRCDERGDADGVGPPLERGVMLPRTLSDTGNGRGSVARPIELRDVDALPRAEIERSRVYRDRDGRADE